jgi:hypothetical protein
VVGGGEEWKVVVVLFLNITLIWIPSGNSEKIVSQNTVKFLPSSFTFFSSHTTSLTLVLRKSIQINKLVLGQINSQSYACKH